MTAPPDVPGSHPGQAAPPRGRTLVAAAAVVTVLVLVAGSLLALVILGRPASPAAAAPTPGASAFAYADRPAAPPLELTDQDGRPFALASQLGRPVLVFFGYTHCPDVCPATVGIVNEVLAAVGEGPRVAFTSIDPERDDPAAMKSYLRYLPAAWIGLAGSPTEIAVNADAWGVKYAKQETGHADGYAMAHTADIFLVDAQGRLRARYPFGTTAAPIAEDVRALLAETPPPAVASSGSAPPVAAATPSPATPAPATATPSPAPAATGAAVALYPEVVSTSIWSGGPSPVIVRATDATGRALGVGDPLTVQLERFDGTPAGEPVPAAAVLPTGEDQAAFVATMSIPEPGAWRLRLTSGPATGDIPVQVLPAGATLPIGAPAPDIDTPTLDDVAGVVRAVTTEPNPDLRMSRTSTADARAMGRPYVIVIDSSRFRVSPECGRALTMSRFLLDRWEDEVVFVHLEPFEYQVITQEPVLSGTLTDPPLNEWTRAWGLGDRTWPAVKMPWIFVVDGSGTVRAKYTGLVGTADVDVILSQIAAESGS
jgi:protein SCO1/2